MAEEQIDKLTIAVESVGGDDKSIADIRKQLEKLGRVDLSNTVRQLGNLRTALGYLGTVDDSVKSMLDNMVKLGLRASSAREVTKTFKEVSNAAAKAEKDIRDAQEAYSKWVGGKPSITISQDIKEDTRGSYNFGLGRDMSDEESRAIRENAAAKRVAKQTEIEAKKSAAGEWFDAHANTKSYHKETLKGLKDQFFGVGNAAKDAGQKAKNALDQTNNAAKKTQKTTSKLADAFVRIVRFKIVASVLQNVIQSAKEGTTALGEFDAEFKETLNTYSAASKAAGGSFALTLAPALEAAAPLIEYIADGIGSIGNSISMITAMIKGDDFYQAVKPVSQIKKEMAAAEEKAKNVKQLISGFDELNIFQKPDTDETGVKIFEDQELSWGNDALREDLANLAEFVTVAGAAALVVGFLKNAFSGKNKTLKEQTDLTKEDVKETQTMKDVVSALIPQVNGVTSALGYLGGMGLPALDSSGITVPAGEAVGALDALGAKQPAPTVATEPLLAGVNLLEGKVNEFVTAEYAPVLLSASDAQLLADLRAATEKINEFANGLSPAFDAEYTEIKKGWSTTLGGMQDMAQKSASAVGVTYKTAFGGVVDDWDTSMVQIKAIAVDAFAQIEYQFKVSVGNMAELWNAQFGGLTVNTPETNTTPETSTTGRTTTEAVKHLFGEDAMKGASLIFGTKTDDETANAIEATVQVGGLMAGAANVMLDAAGKAAATAAAAQAASEATKNATTSAAQNIATAAQVIKGGASQVAQNTSTAGWGKVITGGTTAKLPDISNPFRNVSGYAGGGLVTAGEFFMARENGMPEYVGSFGNHTGVANNEQIVSGIAGGVESALAAYIPQIIRAIEENATAVNIGDDQIARAAQRGAASYQRRTGRSMFN